MNKRSKRVLAGAIVLLLIVSMVVPLVAAIV